MTTDRRWTDLTPEERAAALATPITIQTHGGTKSWGGCCFEHEQITVRYGRSRTPKTHLRPLDTGSDIERDLDSFT